MNMYSKFRHPDVLWNVYQITIVIMMSTGQLDQINSWLKAAVQHNNNNNKVPSKGI